MLFKKFLAAILLISWICTPLTVLAANLPDFVILAKQSGSAVVNIGTEKTSKGDQGLGRMMPNMPPGFERFFEQFERFNQPRRPQKQRSLGSGFIVSADGYIVTNNHVVAGADIIRINLEGATGQSESLIAKLIGSDEETDLALLKVESSKPLPFLRFGDSDKAQVGEWLLAIGNPFGLDHTVTAGILSAKGRNIRSGPFDNFLQTDASINPGNSGGPLLNMAGEVIGINTAIIASGQGIGFAIPSNMAAQITEELKGGNKVRRGWIGVTIQDVDENAAKALGMKKAHGVLIGNVMPGEPAAKGGMKAGDVVIAINGKDVDDSAALLRTIAAIKPGSTATITVWRDGVTKDLKITLGERTAEQLAAQRDGQGRAATPEQAGTLGLTVRALNADEARSLKLEKGQGLIVTKVDQDKAAAEADIREGDVIITANMAPVNDVSTLAKIVQEATPRGAVMLQIHRRGEVFFRPVPLK